MPSRRRCWTSRAGIGTYRWEGSFLSWAYVICARRVARQARAAQLCGCSEAAFRQRLTRARRTVGTRMREAGDDAPVSASDQEQDVADELDRLVRLGELARARTTSADAAATERAVQIAAPRLMGAVGAAGAAS